MDAGEHHEWFGYLASVPLHINEPSNWFNGAPRFYSSPKEEEKQNRSDIVFVLKQALIHCGTSSGTGAM